MSKKHFLFVLAIFIVGVVCIFGISLPTGLWMYLRPHPSEITQDLYNGVIYQRILKTQPRPIIIHMIRVDLSRKGVNVLVTPGNPDSDLPLFAQTTSQFLEKYGVQIAINGDGFEPWYSRTFLNYYPHSGDPVDVLGQAVSNGIKYSETTDAEPTLFFSKTKVARINQLAGKTYNAISGNELLIQQGKTLPNLDSSIQPRTAVGLDKRRRELILIVVDGRQPGYSEGVTLAELATIMLDIRVHEAINLDGGGSSTLVFESPTGKPSILNSPINHGIPGLERPVANHLGIYAQPLTKQD